MGHDQRQRYQENQLIHIFHSLIHSFMVVNTKEELQQIAAGNLPKRKGKVLSQSDIDKAAEKAEKRQIKRGAPVTKDRTVNRTFSHKQPEANSREARMRDIREGRIR